jgi:hypothetical protein
VPPGWIAVDPPADDSPAAWCANSARDEWNVALTADSSALLLSEHGGERLSDTVAVADGLIVGSDMGEFGGAIWWSGSDGRTDTLRVEGRGSTRFVADNLHGFVRRQGGLYALVGLAHLSIDVGELLYLSRDGAGRWHAKHVMTLSGSPSVYTLIGTDSALVLAGDTLSALKFDSIAPGRRSLYGNPAWGYAYPSSLLRDKAGTVYMGMRSAVARLTPTAHGYHEDWLVQAQCRRRMPVGDQGPCRCEPGG